MDEAHFRADVKLRRQWVLRGEAALVDSSSPRLGEKATCYSAVCLETGEVEAMPVEGNCNADTSLTTPNLQLRLVSLPAYSLDFNPDEAIWAWVPEEVTANTCFGTAAKIREKVDAFFSS